MAIVISIDSSMFSEESGFFAIITGLVRLDNVPEKGDHVDLLRFGCESLKGIEGLNLNLRVLEVFPTEAGQRYGLALEDIEVATDALAKQVVECLEGNCGLFVDLRSDLGV